MKVLLVHNHYQQPGGEDQVFAAEMEVLRSRGEDVRAYTTHNDRIASMSGVTLAAATVWNHRVFRELSALMEEFRPDLVHCHNTFPLISPAAYSAARRAGIPVIQTLHNFRLLCVNGLFLRQGRSCELCLRRRMKWPGILHRCYRGSARASAVVAGMIGVHRWRGTWAREVDTYIAMTEFSRSKFVAGGLPAHRIMVKPNFLPRDPGPGAHQGGFALYVGRLSPEKGIESLVRHWSELAPGVPLRVIGSGPLEWLASTRLPGVEWLGWQPHDRVLAAMKDAGFLVFPTECYENFPMVVLEAMASGLPVVASRRGSLPEIVRDGVTGVLVPSGRAEDWAEALRRVTADPDASRILGREARAVFQRSYTPESGYRGLMEVYQATVQRGRVRAGAG